MTIKDLCVLGELPGFYKVFKEIFSTKYEEEPDYGKILFLFQKILLRNNKIPGCHLLDWEP
jgi:hypothetical protein